MILACLYSVSSEKHGLQSKPVAASGKQAGSLKSSAHSKFHTMPSAFRRAGAKSQGTHGNPLTSNNSSTVPSLLGYRGVKPWAGGIHLTSSGLNDFDVILGGGQPLGTCILLREDRWTRDLALSLVKYWAAEAISQEQRLLIPVAKKWSSDVDNVGIDSFMSLLDGRVECCFAGRGEVEEILLALPKNLHWEKQKRKDQQPSEQTPEASQSLTILEEEDEEEGDADEGLQVAWQYKKSVQQQRLGLQPSLSVVSASSPASITNVFCHSYDLSGRMNEQRAIDVDSHLAEMMSLKLDGESTSAMGLTMFRDLVGLLQNAETGGKAIRLLLFHLDLEIASIALPLLMAHIRQQSLPVVVLVCSQPTADSKAWVSLSRTADVVMSTEGFASRKEYPPPPEFQHLQGLFTLSKVSTVTAATANGGGHFADLTTSKRPSAFIYGFKRDRRKLHIPLLHIPPEDYAEGGGSVGSGVRSGAGKQPSDGSSAKRPSSGGGMGCASNMAGSALDF